MKKATNEFLRIMQSRILDLRTLFKNQKRNQPVFVKVRVNSEWRKKQNDE